jgi:MoaA/NifB/PqqE/SkfB family radical SAM enzyme
MNQAYALKLLRNLRNVVAFNANRLQGREFIPAARDCIYIETSSLCNLDCRFCAYPKKQSAKTSMSQRLFESCVQQAVELGYRQVDLTPCTGDVFMDRGLLAKLAFLETHPQIRDYAFHTNFTVPDRDDIDKILQLKKLASVTISVYGCDMASFKAITQSTDKVYQRLVGNLEFLHRERDRRNFVLTLSVHPGRPSLRGVSSDITRLAEQFAKAGTLVKIHKGAYNNWGGYISKEDVSGLPIEVISPKAVYKNGACVRLMTTVQIMATGIVNGCACRDADATLRLGDINQTPLRDLISSRNAAYMNLIDEQQRGEFQPVCRSCDFYASIYRHSSSYRKNGVALISLAQFKASLS